MIKVNKLKCIYNDKIVGYLIESKSGKVSFQYDDEWLENGFSISPFSLPLSKEIYTASKDTLGGLFGVFWDSLPDGWGELLLRRKMAKNGINFDKVSILTRLSLVGKNGLGAINYIPTQFETNEFVNYDLDSLALEADKILNSEESKSLDELYYLGGSSGGARPKAHIIVNNEEWIVKFPSHIDPKNIGELEYKTNILAQKCGIKTAEVKLFESKINSGFFGCKRFDRKDNKRIHMISLSSLLETSHRIPNLDYIHLFKVIQKICVNQDDMYEAFRRMCFNVFYKNKDDHGKNFSFIYNEEKMGYELSLAYDLTSLPNKFEHEMTVNGNGNPSEKDLIYIAKMFNLRLDISKQIIDNIKKILSVK